MNIVTVVGARPQFVIAAVVSHALREEGLSESLVHTGQHYDANMSDVFFGELGIPAPAHNLGVGSGSHGQQTAAMMTGLESILKSGPRPDAVLVYGDTNSTLAAGMVASKLNIPLAHVEAGLRSFNWRMPEEINRIVTDRLSEWLFCPTPTAVSHLRREGMTRGVIMSGDVMLDATRFFAERAASHAPLDSLTDLKTGSYHLATVHRAENTDDPARLSAIFSAFGRLDKPILLPLHPRTLAKLKGLDVPSNVRIIEPVSYLSMLTLLAAADRVLTDSGGLQKEAVWLGRPCVTLRDETEWTETTQGGWNEIVGADQDAILAAVDRDPDGAPPSFGEAPDGTASTLIATTLSEA